MADAKPKRIKIRITSGAVIVLGLKQASANQSTALTDGIQADLFVAQTCADQANNNDSFWTEYENDVFAGVEEVEAALAPNATNPSLSSAASTLHNAVVAWKENS